MYTNTALHKSCMIRRVAWCSELRVTEQGTHNTSHWDKDHNGSKQIRCLYTQLQHTKLETS
jgi:hypothetical protein